MYTMNTIEYTVYMNFTRTILNSVFSREIYRITEYYRIIVYKLK